MNEEESKLSVGQVGKILLYSMLFIYLFSRIAQGYSRVFAFFAAGLVLVWLSVGVLQGWW